MTLTRKASTSNPAHTDYGTLWEKAPKTLVVATDFSVASQHACEQALHWLLPGLQHIVLLHVLPQKHHQARSLVQVEDILQNLATKRLIRQRNVLQQTWDIPFTIECISREGALAKVVQDVCSQYKNPMVVMGNSGNHQETEGKQGSGRMELLSDFSMFPVLAFSRYKNASAPKNILYASDVFEMDIIAALKPLVGLAIPHQATIHIGHIAERNILQSPQTEGPDRDLVPRYLELFPEVAFTYRNLNGNQSVLSQLRSMVSELNIDMIFTVMQQHGFYHNFLQSNSKEDAFFNAMPVLTVRI